MHERERREATLGNAPLAHEQRSVKEHPILFSAPMVQALLADRKHVTRRLDLRWTKVKAGDRLWVRETFYCDDFRYDFGVDADIPELRESIMYRADGEFREQLEDHSEARWRPSIHMPRWASRILLECEEDARIERLQDITDDEAEAEGIYDGDHLAECGSAGCSFHPDQRCCCGDLSPVEEFSELWDTLHNNPGERFADNPEVVRIGRFHRVGSV